MHFLTVFWKVLFAFVPPTDYWNGWACFVVSILMIGLLTAFIGDLASHFGCTIGLKDSVTAVVFVALGTSVPGEDSHRGGGEGPSPPRLGLGLALDLALALLWLCLWAEGELCSTGSRSTVLRCICGNLFPVSDRLES